MKILNGQLCLDLMKLVNEPSLRVRKMECSQVEGEVGVFPHSECKWKEDGGVGVVFGILILCN